jgi:hypothetical protein
VRLGLLSILSSLVRERLLSLLLSLDLLLRGVLDLVVLLLVLLPLVLDLDREREEEESLAILH